jgi:formylglycine-generating enzyme required for sulfatase activity
MTSGTGHMRRRGSLALGVVRELVRGLILGLFLCCLAQASAWAEKRVALVIGNGAYANAPRLPNPTHDADDVAAALKNIDFDVIRGTDLDQAGMQDAVVRFARAAQSADVGFFYYSGHAMQFNGVNYLMPVDARLDDEADLYRFTRVDDVLRYLQQVKALKILVLDSCRDNPLAETLKRSVGATRAVSLPRGLAPMEAPTGMIVSYATQAGRTAADGTGRNSPYTAAFLRHIEEPAEIGDIFRDINADVFHVTGEKQLPELSLSIIGKFYLKGPVSVTVTVPPRPAPADPCAAAGDHWRSAESIGTLAAFEDHLARFPDCSFAGLAKARIDALRRQAAVVAPPAAGVPEGSTAGPLGGVKPLVFAKPVTSAAPAKPPPSVSPCGSAEAVSVSLSSLRGAKPLTVGEECGLRPRDVFKECDKCPEMVVAPAGAFLMGAGDAKARQIELPRHQVTIAKPFAVGKIHVTRAQFMAFVGETGYDTGSCFSGDLDLEASKSGDHPVVCVNFADANAYVRWLSTKTGQEYRLLTESEFEFAARAGTVTEWFWGDKRTDAKAYAHCADCSGNMSFVRATVPAGSLKPNAFGLYDMSGNAYQMVQDCYQANYNGAPTDGSARGGGLCPLRVIRGGSWQKTLEWGRSASRFLQSADMRTNEAGFRVARTLR